MLANGDGLALMEEFRSINPEVPTIILTAHGSIESAVEAMRRGAYSYLTKPFEPAGPAAADRARAGKPQAQFRNQAVKRFLDERYDFANIIARSAKMRSVLDVVTRIAKLDSTVHIHGESGTGKELIAKAIHLASDRKDKSFVALNCAALPETLLESELFGHEKGAFTGAVKSTGAIHSGAWGHAISRRDRRYAAVDPVETIARLQERQFYPVGSEVPPKSTSVSLSRPIRTWKSRFAKDCSVTTFLSHPRDSGLFPAAART